MVVCSSIYYNWGMLSFFIDLVVFTFVFFPPDCALSVTFGLGFCFVTFDVYFLISESESKSLIGSNLLFVSIVEAAFCSRSFMKFALNFLVLLYFWRRFRLEHFDLDLRLHYFLLSAGDICFIFGKRDDCDIANAFGFIFPRAL